MSTLQVKESGSVTRSFYIHAYMTHKKSDMTELFT